MTEMTITEALAELKTLKKRIEKKRELIMSRIALQGSMRDPLEREGGTRATNKADLQSINDMNTRYLAIRTGISRANIENKVTVNGIGMTVAEWLAWRRDIAPGVGTFTSRMLQKIAHVKQDIINKGLSVKDKAEGPTDVEFMVDEKHLGEWQDSLETTLGELDGKLSLFNATHKISL